MNTLTLRHARLARQLDISQLAARTAIKPHLLEAIEHGRFDDLPAGIYARSYVRAYASAVGLDPVTTLQQLEPVLPPAPEPLAALRAAADRTTGPPLPVTRLAARIADAVLLCGLDIGIITFVSLATGIAVDELLRSSGAVAVPCGVPIAGYFVLFGLLAGQTPGEWLCNCPARRTVRIRVK